MRLSLSGNCKSRDKIWWRWKKFSNPGTVDLWNDNRSNNGTSLGTTTLWPTQVFHKCDCSDQNLSRRLQHQAYSQQVARDMYGSHFIFCPNTPIVFHENTQDPILRITIHKNEKYRILGDRLVVSLLRSSGWSFTFNLIHFIQTVGWQLINKMFSRLLLVENSLDDNDKQ